MAQTKLRASMIILSCALLKPRLSLKINDTSAACDFTKAATLPSGGTKLPVAVLSEEFTHEKTAKFLARRQRTPIKGVLLMQEHFLGVGNWMADEILWRAAVHPATSAGAVDEAATQRLWEQTRWVSATAIRIISDDWTYPPDWLFAHRWEAGGECPRCHTKLDRATIGGRTTCWCPQCQPTITAIAVARKSKAPLKAPANKKGASKHAKTSIAKPSKLTKASPATKQSTSSKVPTKKSKSTAKATTNS